MTQLLALIKWLLILVLLATAAVVVLQHNSDQRKILVVHSYNKDLAWVNDINEGISRSLASADVRNLNVRTHYMDLKNHPNCNFYQNAAADVRFTISDWQPEVVVLVDDLAQALVGFNQLQTEADFDRSAQAESIAEWLASGRCENPGVDYFGLQREASLTTPTIIFAGVNGTVTQYGYDAASNVAGIYEHKNYKALIETLQTLSNASELDVAAIQMVNDHSATGIEENRGYLLQDWSPFNAKAPLAVSSFEQWQQAVLQANADNTMLLIANYQNLTEGDCPEPTANEACKAVSPKEVISWTERNALLPVLGANTNFVADGGLMTVAISGTEQGQVAMDLALDALSGTLSPDYLEAKQFIIGMNQSLVRKRQLDLPGIYEAFSREIGQFVDVVETLYMEQASAENE